MSEKENNKQVKDEAVVPVLEEAEEMSYARRLAKMDFEMQAAQHAAGMKENTYGVWGPIWKFMQWYDSKRVEHTFKKKTYMWLMLFTGFFGGHRWYQGRRWLAFFETIFFWTGVPAIMMVTDFMEVFPIKADENGYITMR